MNFFKTVVAVLLANIVLAFLIFVFFAVTGVTMKLAKEPGVKDGSWLVVDIYGEVLPYDAPETIASYLTERPETLHRILTNLEKATVDDRIHGVIMKISASNTMGAAMMEEVRDAIHRVREAGKPVYAYSDGLDRSSLFLASACDSIFMPEVGDVNFTGMGAVMEYFKGTLDKLGIVPNIHKIDKYKTAAETVTRKDMSPEGREMMNWLVDEMWDMELSAIAHDRGLSRKKLVDDMNYALFTAEEARDAGFVDRITYWSDLTDQLKGDQDELETVSEADYAKVTRASVGLDGKDRIAVVHAWGMIGGRQSRTDAGLGVIMGHDTVVRNLRAAAEDDKVKAIIFRVDSQGGEALASDIIGHEVERIARKKPVIVSMVDVAASGGYSISYRATKLVADSMTITGSIGSISGKFNMAGLYNKIGVTFDSVTKGPNALFWSGERNFTDAQRKRFEDHHWDGFNIWLDDVARKRGIPVDSLSNLAGGRVWTGRQAEANGLIDDMGDLQRAIAIAKEEAGIPAAEHVTLVDYPHRKGLLAILAGRNASMASMNWIVWHYLHYDLAETLRLMTETSLRLWQGEPAR